MYNQSNQRPGGRPGSRFNRNRRGGSFAARSGDSFNRSARPFRRTENGAPAAEGSSVSQGAPRGFNRNRPSNRGGFAKGGFGGNRGFSRGGRGRFQQKADPRLDHSKYVNKTAPVEKEAPYVPTHAFTDFAIDEKLKHNIVSKGYKMPTPIQDKSIPHVLQGKDVVGIANTGTGKTAAFLIPLINKILKNRNERVIILAPTRELAIQINDEFRLFSPGLQLHSAIVVGGASEYPQIQALKRHPNFVIGTPGRIKDFLERRILDLSKFQTIVLDEADRMLDMGFINDMRYLMQKMPEERHTLFFSATLSPEIERLIGDFLTDPVRVSVKTRDTSKNIDQDVVKVPRGGSKIDMLHDLLINPEFEKVLIFGRTKHGVERLSKTLMSRGFKAESIHGNKSHNQRQRALGLFKDNRVQVLVATDVAARGLDIPAVTHVINYDTPTTYEDYIHRIGRTGRADRTGKALTFIEE